MSKIELTPEEVKAKLSQMRSVLTSAKADTAVLEVELERLEKEKGLGSLSYRLSEWHRHGEEFTDYFTDEKIDELYE